MKTLISIISAVMFTAYIGCGGNAVVVNTQSDQETSQKPCSTNKADKSVKSCCKTQQPVPKTSDRQKDAETDSKTESADQPCKKSVKVKPCSKSKAERSEQEPSTQIP